MLPLQPSAFSLQPSAVRSPPPPLLSASIQGGGRPPPPHSSVHAHDTLLSALLPQQVDSPLQPSDVNTPHLPQLLAFPLQRDVLTLHPLSTCAPPPPLSISLWGQGKPPLLPSTVCTYVPLISALLLWKGVPLPQLSALPLQQGVPPLQPLTVRAPPTLSVLLQGISIPPLLPSAVRAYATLLSRSSSRWDFQFHSYVLTIYVRLY